MTELQQAHDDLQAARRAYKTAENRYFRESVIRRGLPCTRPEVRRDYAAAYRKAERCQALYNKQLDLQHERHVRYFAGGTLLASLAVGGYLIHLGLTL